MLPVQLVELERFEPKVGVRVEGVEEAGHVLGRDGDPKLLEALVHLCEAKATYSEGARKKWLVMIAH